MVGKMVRTSVALGRGPPTARGIPARGEGRPPAGRPSSVLTSGAPGRQTGSAGERRGLHHRGGRRRRLGLDVPHRRGAAMSDATRPPRVLLILDLLSSGLPDTRSPSRAPTAETLARQRSDQAIYGLTATCWATQRPTARPTVRMPGRSVALRGRPFRQSSTAWSGATITRTWGPGPRLSAARPAGSGGRSAGPAGARPGGRRRGSSGDRNAATAPRRSA
jgi:hypothetical protein